MSITRTKLEARPIPLALAAALEASGRDGKSVSLAAGLSESACRDILNGKAQNPRFSTLEAIAAELRIPVSRLLGGDPGPAARGVSAAQAGDGSPFGAPILSTTPDQGGDDLPHQGRAGLCGADLCFALYVPDQANAPRCQAGEVLICHRTAPPLERGLSVVSTQARDVIIGRLIRQGAEIEIERSAARDKIVMPAADIVCSYRVMAIQVSG
jgi:transcriptional regulator with XRE-family HTH domain